MTSLMCSLVHLSVIDEHCTCQQFMDRCNQWQVQASPYIRGAVLKLSHSVLRMNPEAKQGMYSCGSAPPKATPNLRIGSMIPETDHDCTFQVPVTNEKKKSDHVTFAKVESVSPSCTDCFDLYKTPEVKIDINKPASKPILKVRPNVLNKPIQNNQSDNIWFVNLEKGSKNWHTTIRNNPVYHGWYQCPFDPHHRIKNSRQYIKHAKNCIALSNEGFNGKLPKKRASEWILCQYNHNHLIKKDREQSHFMKNCIF